MSESKAKHKKSISWKKTCYNCKAQGSNYTINFNSLCYSRAIDQIALR